MVRPFEDAAFSQQKNAIGPVVETDFGFHIIQILEHQTAQVLKLDGETKKRITAFVERQKQHGAFDGMVKRLEGGSQYPGLRKVTGGCSMRNRKAGKIRERLWYLGRGSLNLPVREGESCSLILSGGMSYLVPVVLKQIRDFGIDEGKIRNF